MCRVGSAFLLAPELNPLNAPAFTLLQVGTTTLGIPEAYYLQWAKGRLVVLVADYVIDRNNHTSKYTSFYQASAMRYTGFPNHFQMCEGEIRTLQCGVP
jgi:hypothetical protein